MDVPRLDRSARQYFFAWDFGTDVRALRGAAAFPVPSPGLTLAGLRLADVLLGRSRGPGRLVDGGGRQRTDRRSRGIYLLLSPQFDLPLSELRAALRGVANS
jgi:hypothetical protein